MLLMHPNLSDCVAMVFEFVSLAFVGASKRGLPRIYRERIIP